MFNFVFDNFVGGYPWPNLIPVKSTWDFQGFEQQWPHITPCRLHYYVRDHEYPHNNLHTNQELPSNSWYPIGIGFFNYAVDYFSLIPAPVLNLAKNKKLRILFYYHEGDNPYREKQRLDSLCATHNLDTDIYRFVSGNTAANNIPGFVYFADFELWYWRDSKHHAVELISMQPRSRDFTALCRIHKWWRASVILWLLQNHVLDNSYWSYNAIDIGEKPEWNPIRLMPFFPEVANGLDQFLKGAPYTCDSLSTDDHNNHTKLVKHLYNDSYFHLVLETHFDAEQSQHTFLSEKTFKPIRHGQPFVIVGTPGSLATLKSLGYRCFEHVLDNSYDDEIDNHLRVKKLFGLFTQIKDQNLRDLFYQCYDDVVHNQQVFISSKYNRLEELDNNLL
jgi:hypothetical protein